MPGPSSTHPRIRRLADVRSGSVWIDAVESLDIVQVLKQDRGTLVCRVRLRAPPFSEVIVKRWRLSTVAARIKSKLGQSRAFRHWRGAGWLASRAIASARCLAILTHQDHEYLIMEHIEGPTLLDCLARGRLGPRPEHAIARVLARQMVAMTLAGRYNRDHKPSNLIVQHADSPEPAIVILDTVAIHKLRPWRRADLFAMFASLLLEPLGCSCPPRRSLMMRVLVEHQRELLARIPDLLPADASIRRAARHADWGRVAAIIAAHGDPTPRVNPLARNEYTGP